MTIAETPSTRMIRPEVRGFLPGFAVSIQTVMNSAGLSPFRAAHSGILPL